MPPAASLPRIRRLRAPNASPLTHTGTNSYILGSGRVALIDPGPDDPDHLQALLAALDPGESVSHILITHPHRDHSALAPRLAARTGAPILGMGRATEGRSPLMTRLADAGFCAQGGDGLDHDFRPDRRIHHSETLVGEDWELTVHHTPGHLGTHVCLAIGTTLFSGDHVMGWSTSVVMPPDGDMAAYRESLRELAARDWSLLLPGHGEAIEDPAARLAELIAHRDLREAQIIAALATGAADLASITARLYPGLGTSLVPAARQNVLAHLLELMSKNRIAPTDPSNPATLYALA